MAPCSLTYFFSDLSEPRAEPSSEITFRQQRSFFPPGSFVETAFLAFSCSVSSFFLLIFRIDKF